MSKFEDLNVQVEQPSISVTFTQVLSYKTKTYRAGVVYPSLGGTPLGRCVAVMAGTDKFLSTPEDVMRWLGEKGLPERQATKLIQDAMKDDDQAQK